MIIVLIGSLLKKSPSGIQLFVGQCLRQEAFSSLHCTTGLHFVPPPYVPFRSLSAPASTTHARVSPSFHCAQVNPPFHSAHLRLFLLTIHITQPKREASFHQPYSLHFIQSSPLLSPTQSAVCPAI